MKLSASGQRVVTLTWECGKLKTEWFEMKLIFDFLILELEREPCSSRLLATNCCWSKRNKSQSTLKTHEFLALMLYSFTLELNLFLLSFLLCLNLKLSFAVCLFLLMRTTTIIHINLHFPTSSSIKVDDRMTSRCWSSISHRIQPGRNTRLVWGHEFQTFSVVCFYKKCHFYESFWEKYRNIGGACFWRSFAIFASDAKWV